MPYKCIIVDDEEPARSLLNDYCEKVNDIEVVGLYKNPLDCLPLMDEQDIDIIFLDINMPEISGIDFLKNTLKITTGYINNSLS